MRMGGNARDKVLEPQEFSETEPELRQDVAHDNACAISQFGRAISARSTALKIELGCLCDDRCELCAGGAALSE
jgi:hypothetical protein